LGDWRIRRRICEHIANSGIFQFFDFALVRGATNEPRRRDSDPANTPGENGDDVAEQQQRDENSYCQREFDLADGFYRFEEYVFECPLEDWLNKVAITFYVSKEYNVGPLRAGEHMPGRFVFKNFTPGRLHPYNYVVLAEQPATAYLETNFNVELHYLRMRKYVKPGKIAESLAPYVPKVAVAYGFQRLRSATFRSCHVVRQDKTGGLGDS
jgi:hypothetical protein